MFDKCFSCGGSGREHCEECNGHGKKQVTQTNYSHEQRECGSCHGSTIEYGTKNGSRTPCFTCGGRGWRIQQISHDIDAGYSDCENCDGNGDSQCDSCDGTGAFILHKTFPFKLFIVIVSSLILMFIANLLKKNDNTIERNPPKALKVLPVRETQPPNTSSSRASHSSNLSSIRDTRDPVNKNPAIPQQIYEADVKLNLAYKLALGRLDQQQQNALRNYQRNWVKQRDAAAAAARAPSEAQSIILIRTIARTRELERYQ